MNHKYTVFAVMSVLFFVYGENAESQDTAKMISNRENVEEILAKISGQSNDFSKAAKSIQDGDVYKEPETIDSVINAFERQYRSIKRIEFYFERLEGAVRLEDADAVKLRPTITAAWLSFRKVLYESFDKNHDFSIPVYKNLEVNGPYTSGIEPKDIKEPDIRKDYEERLAKNTQLAYERRVQFTLQQLLEDATKEMESFLCSAYEREPRADDDLVQAMKKYELPEDVRIAILSKIGIPYKGFRTWESTDGLFKTTAKFIFYDAKVKEATLEKANGKQTTIEWSALRKEDQEYIRRQIELDPKKLKD